MDRPTTSALDCPTAVRSAQSAALDLPLPAAAGDRREPATDAASPSSGPITSGAPILRIFRCMEGSFTRFWVKVRTGRFLSERPASATKPGSVGLMERPGICIKACRVCRIDEMCRDAEYRNPALDDLLPLCSETLGLYWFRTGGRVGRDCGLKSDQASLCHRELPERGIIRLLRALRSSGLPESRPLRQR